MEIRALQLAVIAILDNALDYEWSVQGFGMLRLYIRDIGRLHIWDSALRYPDVSMVHNHSWDLRSTIVAGVLQNTTFTEHTNGGWFSGKRLVTGYHTRDVVPLPPTLLSIMDIEEYRAGDCYQQRASLIHRTDAEDGTITIMERQDNKEGQADVYWPAGTEWGTAKPRQATVPEVLATTERALAVLLA